LLVGFFVSLSAMPGLAMPGAPARSAVVGVFAVIFLPILYGVLGGSIAAISAFIYNFAAARVGGLELGIRQVCRLDLVLAAGWSGTKCVLRFQHLCRDRLQVARVPR
jgi:hypothetical protein